MSTKSLIHMSRDGRIIAPISSEERNAPANPLPMGPPSPRHAGLGTPSVGGTSTGDRFMKRPETLKKILPTR